MNDGRECRLGGRLLENGIFALVSVGILENWYFSSR
jgi:hypothetical protein